MYVLPDEWEQFYYEMCNRAKIYIKINYWDITEENLLLWLKNFSTDHEKFLSALLIYRIIYRNKSSRLSMYHHIIEIIIPNILSQHDIFHIDNIDNFHSLLKNDPWLLPFKFSTISDVDNSPSKSGPQVLREFRREGNFHKKLETSFNELANLDKQRIKAIILFDDIMGTGEQFKTYLDKVSPFFKDFLFIYCPLVAHQNGINNVTDKYSNVIIAPVEIVDEKYSFFKKDFLPKIAENIDLNNLENFYIKFMHTNTKLPKKDYFAKDKQSLTYIFNLSTPNNTLPIFWYEEENQWEKFFPR